MGKKSGQVLILVLLIVVVALSVGLSVASRNITSLRTSTQTEQSQRAFSAAEGGIEDVLSGGQAEIDRLVAAGETGDTVDVGNIKAKINASSKSSLEDTVSEGNVAQVDLKGTSATEVLIEWAKPEDSANFASIEVTEVYESSGSYLQDRHAFTGGSHSEDEQGFPNPNAVCPNADLVKCSKVTLHASPVLLRIKPFWNSTALRVSSTDVGRPLPEQQYDVSSTAQTELGIVRKVQVTKTRLPQLPASFDYVLYSEGAITK